MHPFVMHNAKQYLDFEKHLNSGLLILSSSLWVLKKLLKTIPFNFKILGHVGSVHLELQTHFQPIECLSPLPNIIFSRGKKCLHHEHPSSTQCRCFNEVAVIVQTLRKLTNDSHICSSVVHSSMFAHNLSYNSFPKPLPTKIFVL